MNVKPALGVVIGITLVTAFGTTNLLLLQQQQQQADAAERGAACKSSDRWPCRGPVAVTGDNIYVAWWTNNTANGNDEVIFRASTDGGATFGDKINLSNTTESESTRVEIDSDVDSVAVTWWETNQTSDTPVMRVSTDNGATFGPMLRLATSGTIGEAAEEEGTEEEGE